MRKRKTSETDLDSRHVAEDGDGKLVTVRVVRLSAAVWLSLGVIVGSLAGGPWLQELVDFARGYRWNPLERCIMEVNEDTGFGVDFCRAPVQCEEVCAGVRGVEEVHVDHLTVEMFEERFAYSSRPLVVRNASIDWPLMHTLTYDWLKELYMSEPDQLMKSGDDCWFNRYKTESVRNLRSVFHMPDERVKMVSGKPWYVGWAVCHEKVAEALFELFPRPSFLSEESTPPRRPWIFIGTPRNGAHVHVDNVDMPSWQLQISGVKTWYLDPPPECKWACHGRIETTIYPGDILVIDTNKWFHSTKAHPGQLSISMVNEYD